MNDTKLSGYPRDPSVAFSQDFLLSVSMGLVPGYSTIDKFGENPDVDTGTAPEDVWEGGGLYTYDADGTAPIVSLISDNAGDAEPIYIQGLDIAGNLVAQIITLTGNTRVALTTPLWRVFRMINIGTSNILGTVYCYVGVGGVPLAADIRALIDDGNNQTLMAVYTIPKGVVGFLHRGELGISRGVAAGEVRCAYLSRRYGEVFTIKKRVNLSNSGSSIYQDRRMFPDPVPSLTDIRLQVEIVSANGIGISGTLDILLVDEEWFSAAFLDNIGQVL